MTDSLFDLVWHPDQIVSDAHVLSDIINHSAIATRIVILDSEVEMLKLYKKITGEDRKISAFFDPGNNTSYLFKGSRFNILQKVIHENAHSEYNRRFGLNTKQLMTLSEKDAYVDQKESYDLMLAKHPFFKKYSAEASLLLNKRIVSGNFYDDVIKNTQDQENIRILNELRREGSI
ncbi:MAG: hypothetical protein WC755_01595 [Candidatus Woesearchaeota archaeon]|jgi:hypothetical protein